MGGRERCSLRSALIRVAARRCHCHSALQFWKDTLAAAASLLLFMTSLRHLCRPDQIFQSNICMRNFHVSADANDATSLGSSNKKFHFFKL